MKERLKLILILLKAKNPYMYQVRGSLFENEQTSEDFHNWKWYKLKALICLLLGRTFIAHSFTYTTRQGKKWDWAKYEYQQPFTVAVYGWHQREMASDEDWFEIAVTQGYRHWVVKSFPNGG